MKKFWIFAFVIVLMTLAECQNVEGVTSTNDDQFAINTNEAHLKAEKLPNILDRIRVLGQMAAQKVEDLVSTLEKNSVSEQGENQSELVGHDEREVSPLDTNLYHAHLTRVRRQLPSELAGHDEREVLPLETNAHLTRVRRQLPSELVGHDEKEVSPLDTNLYHAHLTRVRRQLPSELTGHDEREVLPLDTNAHLTRVRRQLPGELAGHDEREVSPLDTNLYHAHLTRVRRQLPSELARHDKREVLPLDTNAHLTRVRRQLPSELAGHDEREVSPLDTNLYHAHLTRVRRQLPSELAGHDERQGLPLDTNAHLTRVRRQLPSELAGHDEGEVLPLDTNLYHAHLTRVRRQLPSAGTAFQDRLQQQIQAHSFQEQQPDQMGLGMGRYQQQIAQQGQLEGQDQEWGRQFQDQMASRNRNLGDLKSRYQKQIGKAKERLEELDPERAKQLQDQFEAIRDSSLGDTEKVQMMKEMFSQLPEGAKKKLKERKGKRKGFGKRKDKERRKGSKTNKGGRKGRFRGMKSKDAQGSEESKKMMIDFSGGNTRAGENFGLF